MKLEWSAAALADLNRFAAFLQHRHPRLAAIVAEEILRKAEIIAAYPLLGRPIQRREHFREVMLNVLNGMYVLRYAVEGDRVVVLRVHHGREKRDLPPSL